jgi:hypothetical protein
MIVGVTFQTPPYACSICPKLGQQRQSLSKLSSLDNRNSKVLRQRRKMLRLQSHVMRPVNTSTSFKAVSFPQGKNSNVIQQTLCLLMCSCALIAFIVPHTFVQVAQIPSVSQYKVQTSNYLGTRLPLENTTVLQLMAVGKLAEDQILLSLMAFCYVWTYSEGNVHVADQMGTHQAWPSDPRKARWIW